MEEWKSGSTQEWRNGRTEEVTNGGREEQKSAEWRNERMEEWTNGGGSAVNFHSSLPHGFHLSSPFLYFILPFDTPPLLFLHSSIPQASPFPQPQFVLY